MNEKSLLEALLKLCRDPSFFTEDLYTAHVCSQPQWNSTYKEAYLELQDILNSRIRAASGSLFRFRCRLHRTEGHDNLHVCHLIAVYLHEIEEININAGPSEFHVSLRSCRVGSRRPLSSASLPLDPACVCFLEPEPNPLLSHSTSPANYFDPLDDFDPLTLEAPPLLLDAMKSNFSLFNRKRQPQQQHVDEADDDFLSPQLDEDAPLPPRNRNPPAMPPRQPHNGQQQQQRESYQQQQRNPQSSSAAYFGPTNSNPPRAADRPYLHSSSRGGGYGGPGRGGVPDDEGGRRDAPRDAFRATAGKPGSINAFGGTGYVDGGSGINDDECGGGRSRTAGGNSPAAAAAVPYKGSGARAGGGAVVRRNDPQTIPIHKLDKFVAKWAVKGRFINKGEPRTYKNKSGEGRVWSVDLIDSPHPKGCIRCTFFNAAVDKFLDTIQEGHIYRVSRGRLKEKDKRFNQLPHDCELTISEDSEVVWLAVDDPSIPRSATRQLTKIRNLSKKEKGDTVSIVGVVTAKSGPIQITRRSTGEPTTKCDVTLVDDSMASVELSVWGNRCAWAESLDVEENPVVLAEGCRVDEFNGRRLATVGQSVLEVSPQMPEATTIAAWWEHTGRASAAQIVCLSRSDWGESGGAGGGSSNVVTVEEMLKRLAQPEDSAALEDKGIYFTVRATLAEILKHRPFFYPSCPTCRKKVNVPDTAFEEEGTEQAFCDRCNAAVETPIKQYLLNLRVADATGSVEVTAMTDTGKAVLGGVSADALYELQMQGLNSFKTYDDLMEQRCRRDYSFRLRVKSETYRDETKLRYQLVALTPLNGYDAKADPDGATGLNTARKHIISEGQRALQGIYSVISRPPV